MTDRERHIQNYANLLVRRGINVQEGQEVVVQASVEQAAFARTCVQAAYEAGAGHVTVIWGDDAMTRMEYQNAPLSFFEHTPSWKREQLNSLADAGAAFLFIEGSDPDALAGIDPAKPALAARVRNQECDVFRHGLDFGHNVWCIAGAPVAAWARKVFPDAVSDDEACDQLWDAILLTAHATGDDAVVDWDAHDATFERNKARLNELALDALHYSSSNGTDLMLGLNAGHIWEGGSEVTSSGVRFSPNIPTEEVFSTPDRLRADGIVHSAMPLVHAGRVVRDFWLRFEEGRVVEYDAAEGREVLQQIIETDENSCRLGECALIAKDTPIRQTGLLFFDTLYDENASCHLALGMGFPECLEDGLSMDREALIAAGVNQSHTHVDFMIGADDLYVEGIRADGSTVDVFVDGCWAW